MSPGDRDSAKIRLTPRLDSTPSAPASSVSAPVPPELVPPPRQHDPRELRNRTAGSVPSTYFQSLTDYLKTVANPDAKGIYEFELAANRLHYRLRQSAPGTPVEISVTQERGGTKVELLEMSYLPDGSVQSKLRSEPHAVTSLQGAEKFHHSALQNLLARRLDALEWGREWHRRLSLSLEGLEGRYQPETHSIRYDRFAADQNRAYSFVVQHPAGPKEWTANPDFPRIQLLSETFPATDASKTHVLSLAPGGEVDFDPNRPLREVLNAPQQELTRRLTVKLERAVQNPQAYQIALSRALQRIAGNSRVEIPSITPSTRLGDNAGAAYGRLGEPLLEIHSAWDLLRNFHPLARHRWQNPDHPTEVRNLGPPRPLSQVMAWELARWSLHGPIHFLFRSRNDPKQNQDYLRLHLFPSGGGEVTLYRNGALYDIVHQGPEGRIWRAGEEVTQLEINGETFENRFQALEAAVAQRNAPGGADSLRVQRAPAFDLDRFFLGPGETAEPIRDTETAWKLLQKQIPQGIEARVLTDVKLSGEAHAVQVDFFGSEPSLLLRVRESTVRAQDGRTVPRVVVFLERGTDRHARVFEDGRLIPDFSSDVLRSQAPPPSRSTGAYRYVRSAVNLGHFYGVRRVAWALADGLPFALGHYLSRYAVRAFEDRFYTPAEQRLIGTPAPEYSWNEFSHHVLRPYLGLAFFSGLGSLTVDGVYNSFFSRIGRNWKTTPATWFNANPIARPIRRSFLHRILQRGVPPLFGLAGPEFFHTGTIDGAPFVRNLQYVGVASTTSAGLTHFVTRLRPLARGAVRMGLMESAGIGIRGARFTTTWRGGLLLAALEFTLMGILEARDRREQTGKYRSVLQLALGQAIDRRNELLSQSERGVEISLVEWTEANQGLRQARTAYRRFLELEERKRGSGHFQPIGAENDFEDVYASLAREQVLRMTTEEASPASSLSLASLPGIHESRLQELRERRQRMEKELRELYAQYDIPSELPANGSEGLQARPAPPVSVDSPEGQAILEKFRWKAGRDLSFLLWSPSLKAEYLLRQFRGYRIREADGSARPWKQGDALAFLAAVDEANLRRTADLEEPLTLPHEQEGADVRPLQRLLTAEQAIRDREAAEHKHAREHAGKLADNVEDFDRQMEAYLSSVPAQDLGKQSS